MRGLKRSRSILDSVTASASDLQRQLGSSDRSRLDEYLTAVRDVERRIQRAEEQSATELPVVVQPAGIPASYEEHCTLMFDLQVLAYQCDLTRVSTLMLGREYSGRSYPQIGVSEAHHPLSHHQNNPEKIAQIAKVNAYHMSLFSSYLDKLRATPEGDSNLLDNTLLMYGAGMADGNTHDSTNLPILLFGAEKTFNFKGGRHLKYDHEPSATLLVTVLDKLGVPIEKIANSRGKLDLATLSGV